MWDLCAGETVPLAHTLNNLMNTVNAILQGIRALDARQNALRDFTKTFVVGALVHGRLPSHVRGCTAAIWFWSQCPAHYRSAAQTCSHACL